MITICCLQARVIPQPKPAKLPRPRFSPPTRLLGAESRFACASAAESPRPDPQIVILMWTGNNVTRPFRVAGAATLAPAINRGLKSIQEKLNLSSQMHAFALVVGSVASVCSTVVGVLILSKWGK